MTWAADYHFRQWDAQIENDLEAGQLDDLLEALRADIKAGHAKTALNHFTLPSFWKAYAGLPLEVQPLADKNYALLRENPAHPSLEFKRIGQLWSVRIGLHYRALGLNDETGVIWFWTGSSGEFDQILRR